MSSPWRWIVGTLALGTGLAAAYLLLGQPPVGEMLGIVTSGGERVLREPMRPAGSGPRVLVFALDGVGDEEFLASLRSGRAATIASLMGAEEQPRVFTHGYAAPDVLSILPSTTMAAWSSLFTGAVAARTGVPGNEWFVREEMRYYAPAPVSVKGHEHALESYTDGLVGNALRVPTVFERADVRSYVSLSQVYRGADLLIMPSADLLAGLMTTAVQGLGDEETVEQDAYAELDRAATENLVEAIETHGVADLQVVYFPGIDLYTHVAERPLETQRAYLAEVVDPAIGSVLEAYRRGGALEDTYILFVADHGHTPVLNDERHALGTGEPAGPVTLLEQAGFRVRPGTLEVGEEERDFQATVAYQGTFAYVYLADRSTCPSEGEVCDWSSPPRLQEDVLPVAQAFHAADRTGSGAPGLQGTLDLVLAREPRPPAEDALPFQVWDGEALRPIGEYLDRNPRPDLLDFERRMRGLAEGPYGHRAGDVLLIARSGAERPVEERYYFSSRYHSWHGSPEGQDSRIPLVLAHPRESGADLRERVGAVMGDDPRQETITDLILDLLRR